jgi:acyl-coenzyme A synthetase/AMP-(fatty) acid ligase
VYLSKKIKSRINSAKIYDKKGNKVDNSVIKNEFNAIKNHLLKNYNRADIVAIKMDKDYRYLLTLLACMSIGITYIPLNIKWPNKRIEQIRELSGCYVLQEDDIDFLDIKESDVLFENEILYIIFTSGSTGAPKGVKIKREGFINFLVWVNDYFTNINSEDRILLTTDFTFDISLVDISLLLTKDLSLYISNFNNSVFKLLYEIEQYKITTHSTVPYNYSMIMNEDVYPKANLSSLKHIMLGGARFPYNLYYSFKEKLQDCNIYNFYGPTEATIYCSIHKINYNEQEELHKNNITIGKPFFNNEFLIYKDELLISGKQLMEGYLNNEAKTKEALVTINGKLYYKSGDIAFKNEFGNYFIVGRKDDTIKVAGYRVNLSDIDSYILSVEYINNVATIAIDNEEGENDLICYLILNDNENINIKQIKKDFKEIMPSYQIPKYIKVVDEFPLNNSGKICKLTLKDKFLKEQ